MVRKVTRYDFETVIKEKEFGDYINREDYFYLHAHTVGLIDSIEIALAANEISGSSKDTFSNAVGYFREFILD